MWKDLSMQQRADLMDIYLSHGVTSLDEMRRHYDSRDIGTANAYGEGGDIYIKPENRGKFTALKERTGHSATWFKEHGTPAQKKMAIFALNSRHWKHGNGGNLFDGTSQPSQQMDMPNIFRYNDGRYVYQAAPDAEEIEVSPINTLLPNPSQWTYQDAEGKVYTPHAAQVDTGSITQDEDTNPLLRAANNYMREAAYRAKDGTLALQGKYTMPAIAASALLPLAGEAAYPLLTNPYVDATITSGFGAHGLNHAINEGIDGWGDAAMTALEVTPLGRLAKPVYEGVVQPGMRLFNSPLTGNWTKIGNREYRLSPNSLGANGSPIESRKIEDYSVDVDVNKLRDIFEDYEKGLTQYKGAKLPDPLEYKYDTPEINIDFSNLTTDNFVDYLSKQTGRTLKRVPIKDTTHGDIYNEGFAFIDENGKEVAHIAGTRKGGKNVWVESSFVDPEFRYKGLGKQMYFDLNDYVFNKYGTTLHSDPYQRVGSTGVGMSPSNRLWKSLREKGLSSYEGEGFNRHDVMAEPSKITTAYRTSTTPQITAENAASITPEQWTAAQDAAIARGDVAEAQRLRDLHQSLTPTATSGKYYRGTKIKRNSYPDRHIDEEVGEMNGIYLTKKPKYAKTYGDVEEFYLRSNNPLETEGSWTGIIDDATRAEIENAGYDAVVNNRFDTGFLNKLLRNSRDETITFNGKNLKSADAVTFDDNGVRIPLGERDNFNINDIRYGLLPFGIGLTGYGLWNNKEQE